nr:histone acetyltransferase HPA2 [Pseudomonas sp.]
MNDEHTPADLEPIEFESPGRFTLHNPDSPLPPPAAWEPAPFLLGGEQALQRFSLPEQARSHALALMQQARRTLCLYSPDLEPWLYHHGSIYQACTDFLLRHRHSSLRILVCDSSRAVRDGHRLIALSRKLPSHLHIRRCHPDYPAPDGAYLLADDQGLLMRPEADQFAGYAKYQDPARVRQLQHQFDQVWDTSILDPDLRSFLL